MQRIIVLLFFLPVFAIGQIAPNKYFIQFKDKNGTPYSISTPSAYLSARALLRRTSQNISIDSTDLPVTPLYVDSIAAHATVLEITKWLNGVVIYTTDINALNSILALPFVSGMKSLPHNTAPTADNFPFADKFENISSEKSISSVTNALYGGAWNQLAMLHGDYLHDNGFRGAGMLIAVLDAGFQGADTIPVFSLLHSTSRVLATHDFVDGDNMVYDHHNHGTNVLSTMAADLSGSMIGTAPDASYILLRTEDGASSSEYIVEEYNWACGAEFADSAGADVINSSLGYTKFLAPLYNHTYADMNGDSAIATQAADIAASKGILVVNSAGNNGGDPWNFIGSPADADSVLTVGAVDGNGSYATFSSRGPTYDGRVKPNVCAKGLFAFVATPSGGFSGFGNGTSFASPIIAGMAASLWQSCPGYTNMQVLHAIEISADHYLFPDSLYGNGVPDFSLVCKILENGNAHAHSDLLFSFYPNPFTENCYLNFYSSVKQNIRAEVFDIIGKKVLDQTIYLPAIEKYRLTLDGMALQQKGNYILRITTPENVFVRRIVKG